MAVKQVGASIGFPHLKFNLNTKLDHPLLGGEPVKAGRPTRISSQIHKQFLTPNRHSRIILSRNQLLTPHIIGDSVKIQVQTVPPLPAAMASGTFGSSMNPKWTMI